MAESKITGNSQEILANYAKANFKVNFENAKLANINNLKTV